MFKVGDEVVLVKHNNIDSYNNLGIWQEGVVIEGNNSETGELNVFVEWKGEVRLSKQWWVNHSDIELVDFSLDNE